MTSTRLLAQKIKNKNKTFNSSLQLRNALKFQTQNDLIILLIRKCTKFWTDIYCWNKV